MTFIVPFDGSTLAEAALVRATEFGSLTDEAVLAVSVIPNGNRNYAQKRGWIQPDDEFDLKQICSTIHKHVTDLCPSADFRHKVVDKYAPSGTIANRLRRVARDEDASMVFIGSENAGRFVTSLSSVGASVGADTAYDVVIVRHRRPSKIATLRQNSPHREPKSDFYR